MPHPLPYAAASRWTLLMILVIIGINAAVLAHMQDLLLPGAEANDNAFAFGLRYPLYPAPFLLWFTGDPFPWEDVYRLVTHGYLHGGWDHLAFNMLPFIPLAWLTACRIGTGQTVVLYHGLMVLAAIGYLIGARLTMMGYLNTGNYFLPMAGASGAVHGLAGLWVVWAVQDRAGAWTDRWEIAHRLWPAALWLGFVIAVNIWTYVAMDGGFAWFLHVAGVVIGMALAPLIPNLSPRTPK